MNRTLFALTAAIALISASTASAQSTAQLYVVHGIPGGDLNQPAALPVDVSVNGACVLTNLNYKGIVGPLTVPATTLNIAVHYPATGSCSSSAVIGPAAVPFNAGENASVIAHLTPDGKPTASKFVHDLSPTKSGRARFSLHHTAAAPAVDAYLTTSFGAPLSTQSLVTGFTPGEQFVTPVRGDVTQFALTPAGAQVAAFGPVTLRLVPAKTYLLYVVGSLTNRTLDVITKDISELK